MPRYLLDTNHAGTLLRRDAPLWDRLRAARGSQFGLSRPTVGELWFMVFNSTRVQDNRRRLELILPTFAMFDFDAESAIEYGQVRAELRRSGKPIPAIDGLIAAIARHQQLTLLTADAHFGHVAGLQMENWLAP